MAFDIDLVIPCVFAMPFLAPNLSHTAAGGYDISCIHDAVESQGSLAARFLATSSFVMNAYDFSYDEPGLLLLELGDCNYVFLGGVSDMSLSVVVANITHHGSYPAAVSGSRHN